MSENMKKKTLLTSKFCGPCCVLKSKLALLKLTVDTKDYANLEDRAFFHDYNIKSVPRLVVVSEDGTVEVIQGMEDITKAIQEE